MQYKSSADPLYSVVIRSWKSEEKAKFFEWAIDNLSGQFMVINQTSSAYLEQYDRPVHPLNHFGEKNKFAVEKDYYNGLILFTKPEDLSAFLIVFESIIEK